jgi:hypothetical protein
VTGGKTRIGKTNATQSSRKIAVLSGLIAYLKGVMKNGMLPSGR